MPLEVSQAPAIAGLPEAVAPSGGVLRRAARRAFSFPAMLMCGLAVLTVLTARDRFNDPDMWWHLKVGEIVWNTLTLPRADLFSYTTGNHPWIPHEWLAEWTIYGAYRLGGYSGLMLWLCGFGSLVMIGVYALSWMRSGNAKVALVGGMAAWFFATVGLAVRPLILGHLFLVAELIVLEAARIRGRRWLWLLPPLFAVWVNCHGSYSLGLVVLGIHTFCSWVKVSAGAIETALATRAEAVRLTAVFGLCMLALLVNPVGPKLLLYPIKALMLPSTAVVEEWQPPDPNSARGIGLLAVLGLIFGLALAGRAKLWLHECLLLLAVGFLALRHERMLFAFGIVAAPVLCRQLRDSYERYDPARDARVFNAALMAVSLAIAVIAFPGEASLARQTTAGNPAGAVQHIRANRIPGPMLNEYLFGGYLIWAMPEHKVFIDGRADVYDWAGLFPQYAKWATLSEDPRLLLDRHRIGFCLLRSAGPMARVLGCLPGWQRVYADEVAVIYRRSGE